MTDDDKTSETETQESSTVSETTTDDTSNNQTTSTNTPLKQKPHPQQTKPTPQKPTPQPQQKPVPQQPQQPQQKFASQAQKPTTDISKSHNCRLVEDYITRYKKHMSRPVLSDKDLANGADILRMIIMLLATCNDTDAFDAFYDFMVAEKNGLMSDKYALRGISSLDTTMNTRVSVGYRLFREHVTKGNISEYNTKSASDILGASNIITYLRDRKTSA